MLEGDRFEINDITVRPLVRAGLVPPAPEGVVVLKRGQRLEFDQAPSRCPYCWPTATVASVQQP